MSKTQPVANTEPASLRDLVVANPSLILDDEAILEALIAAEDRQRGRNVVDLRSLAMSRLEDRLGDLQDVHQSVLSAAYDTVSTTNQVHRALLTMLEPLDFEAFLAAMGGPVTDGLRLEAIRLVLETPDPETETALIGPDNVIALAAPGFVTGCLGEPDRGRHVLLRPVNRGLVTIYGDRAVQIRSEALMRIDLGPGRLPALLALGASGQVHFAPGQATDLLELFGRTCERILRGYLG